MDYEYLMKFFFIIPVFNDEKSLVKLTKEIKDILYKDSNELNFIIVNDASDEKINNISNIPNAHFINLNHFQYHYNNFPHLILNKNFLNNFYYLF